jgi:hypothetical protein
MGLSPWKKTKCQFKESRVLRGFQIDAFSFFYMVMGLFYPFKYLCFPNGNGVHELGKWVYYEISKISIRIDSSY